VGSGGSGFDSFRRTLKHTQHVFDSWHRLSGKHMDVLDIGGGFTSISSNPMSNFENVAPQVEDYISKEWPAKNKNIKIIGEPGRQIAEGSMALCTQVFLAKKQGNYQHLHVNSGVYSGFGCRIFEDANILGQPLLPEAELRTRFTDLKPTFIWGQTCDGIDYLTKDELYPRIEQGEWMIFRNMGAYNQPTETTFNGFEV